MTTGRTSSCPGGRAFTLLELVLVLVVISTALAIAAPSLRGFAEARQTHNAGARVLALLRYARTRAVADGMVHRLHFDSAGRQFWLMRTAHGAEEMLDGDFGRRFTLPEGTTAEVELGGESDAITIYPSGRAQQVTVTLTGPRGDSVRIVCPSSSERLRIERGEEDER